MRCDGVDDAPRLTSAASACVAVEVPMRYVLGTSAAMIRAAPLLLIDLRDGGGHHRPRLSVLLPAQRRAGDRGVLDGGRREIVQGEPIAPIASGAGSGGALR